MRILIGGTGLELRSDFGDLRLDRVNATDRGAEAGTCDAALICVKTYDNDSAAKTMEGAIGDGTIVCSLQNGIDNERFFGDRFPNATVIAATTRIVAWLEKPGVVVQHGPDVGITLAPFTPEQMSEVERLQKTFADAAVQVGVHPDANSALWLKLAGIASVGTITAYGRCTIGEAFADPTLARLMEDACREVVAIAASTGPDSAVSLAFTSSCASPKSLRRSRPFDRSASRFAPRARSVTSLPPCCSRAP